MTKEEKKWLLLLSIFLILFTSIPYLIGYSREGKDWRFSGFVINLEDGNSYLAKMIRGAENDWLFRTPYTAYPQKGFFSFLPYLLLGKLTSSPNQHDQVVALFHVFRILGIITLSYATYKFISLFIDDLKLRQFGTVVTLLGGGIGWLSLLGFTNLWGGRIPVEFYSPESFGFLMIFSLPHLCFSRAFLLIALREFLLNSKDFSWKAVLKKGLPWVAIGFFQPLTIVSGWLIMGAFWVADIIAIIMQKSKKHLELEKHKQLFLNTIIPIVFSTPFVIYNFLAFQFDPYLKQWLNQNILISPPIIDYLFAYVLFLPLTCFGLCKLIRKNHSQGIFLSLAMVLLLSAAYIPYNLQRRLLEGIFVFLVIAMCVGISKLKIQFVKPITSFMYLNLISTIILVSGTGMSLWIPKDPLYIEKGKSIAYEELGGLVEKIRSYWHRIKLVISYLHGFQYLH